MKSFPTGVRLVAVATAVAMAVLLMAPIKGHAQGQPANTDPVAVARVWVTRLDAHDFDRAVALLDDNAYLLLDTDPSGTNTSSYQGKADIRQALEQYAQKNTRVQIIEGPQEINGTTTWTERQSGNNWRDLGLDSVDMTADAIIDAGRIKSIIYELTPDSAERVANAEQNAGTASQAAPLATASVSVPASPTGLPIPGLANSTNASASATRAIIPSTPSADPSARTVATPTPFSFAPGPGAPATQGVSLGMPRTGAGGPAASYGTWITLLVLVGSGLLITAAGITLRHKGRPS